MNTLVMLFILMLAALTQAVLPGLSLFGHAKVPALGAVVVYYALARDRSDWLTAAIVAGLVQDGMGLIPFGYSSFAFCAMAVSIARFKEMVFVHETFTHMMFGLLMGAGSTVILFVLLSSTGLIEMAFSQAFHKAVGGALLGAVATPLIFYGCARMDGLMGLAESSESTWREIP